MQSLKQINFGKIFSPQYVALGTGILTGVVVYNIPFNKVIPYYYDYKISRGSIVLYEPFYTELGEYVFEKIKNTSDPVKVVELLAYYHTNYINRSLSYSKNVLIYSTEELNKIIPSLPLSIDIYKNIRSISESINKDIYNNRYYNSNTADITAEFKKYTEKLCLECIRNNDKISLMQINKSDFDGIKIYKMIREERTKK
jgi:hypothetical protein